MAQPKRLESYDPAYLEMFTRVAEHGDEYKMPLADKGKAVYLTQRLRFYRKLLIESAIKDKGMIQAATHARMVEIGIEGSTVIVRPVGGSWTSTVVADALRTQSKVLPKTTPVAPATTDTVLEEPGKPNTDLKGYY